MSDRHNAAMVSGGSRIAPIAGRVLAEPDDMGSEVTVRGSLELLTPEELADLLKVKMSWIYDQVEAGRLPALRLNRRLRFRPAEVAAFLEDACAS
jgi:excisionase family DNA binding protein